MKKMYVMPLTEVVRLVAAPLMYITSPTPGLGPHNGMPPKSDFISIP